MNREIGNEKNCFNRKSDWLSQVNNVNDTEAAQVNGGSEASFAAAMAAYQAASKLAAERNLEMMRAGVEVGTQIKASQQRATAL